MGLLYSRMKVFHFHEKIESLPRESGRILAPINIRIKPTNACNHDCCYCAYRSGNLQLGQDMNVKDLIPRDKMFEIIDDISGMGVRAVTFSGGGDPFCYPYLSETVERLAETEIRFAALTNGAFLKGELARQFARHATWLRISMDGWDDESYTEYRGCNLGEFSKIILNMGNFKKLGGPCCLGVCIVVDHRNYTHLFHMIQKLHGIGVDSVKIAPCVVSNSGAENNAYHKQLIDTVKRQLFKAIARFSGPTFEIFDSYHHQLESFAKSYRWCPYLQIAPVIGADLNVYSCHDKAYNLREGLLGSLDNISFKELWHSDKNRFFRIDPAITCNHHCVVDSSNQNIHEYLGVERGHLDFV